MSAIDKLVHELAKLPSVGEKTALRLALHILRQPADYGQALARALTDTIGQMRFCECCCNITTQKLCEICTSTIRDQHVLCIVEDIADLKAIQATHSFRGVYHVLHGALSPIDGIGPSDLKINELENRLSHNSQIQEIILATNPNVNGDATALYLAKTLKRFGIRITKLAAGIPIGGHIEFIDGVTLSRALESRLIF